MPCYTVSTATVQFGTKTETTLLVAAAKQIGVDLRYFDRSTGRVDITVSRGEEESKIGELKRAYSEQVVMASAKKNGWKVQWETNKAGNRVAQVERISR